MVDYLNYQGIDLAKSLLLFSKEEKIYLNDKLAIDYLKIYGANCFGNGLDKKSYDARIQWINDNENDILNFEDGKLLKQAELKLLFLSFCFEYQKYYNNKKSEKSFYYSDFPIKLDSTCNGFQHIALILGDLKIAKNVNITLPKSFDETPMDFYFYIAAKVKERIELMVSNDKLDVNDNDTNSFY
jgi:DNA-directed RNA polymerase